MRHVLAQVVRTATYVPVGLVSVLVILPMIVAWVAQGFTFTVNDSGQAQAIGPQTGLALGVYVMAGLGACVARMGQKTAEDIYARLAYGQRTTTAVATVAGSITVVLTVASAALAVHVMFVSLTGHYPAHPYSQALGFITGSMLFFWLGFALTTLLRNVVVPLAIIMLFPLLVGPLVDRLWPAAGQVLPWGMVSPLLDDAPFSTTLPLHFLAATWVLIIAAGSVLASNRAPTG